MSRGASGFLGDHGQNHGTIARQSEESFGSTFTLTLPLGQSPFKDEELITDDDAAPAVDRLDSADQSDGTSSAESSLSDTNNLSNPTTLTE